MIKLDESELKWGRYLKTGKYNVAMLWHGQDALRRTRNKSNLWSTVARGRSIWFSFVGTGSTLT